MFIAFFCTVHQMQEPNLANGDLKNLEILSLDNDYYAMETIC